MVADATVESANAAGAITRLPQVVTAANAAAAPMRRVSLLFCFMFTSLLLPAPKRLDQVDVVVLSAPEGAAAGVCVLWFADDWRLGSARCIPVASLCNGSSRGRAR